MKADGTGVVRLTNNRASDLNPALSPDKTKIVFVSDRQGNLEIYSMNVNGSGSYQTDEPPGMGRIPGVVTERPEDSFHEHPRG